MDERPETEQLLRLLGEVPWEPEEGHLPTPVVTLGPQGHYGAPVVVVPRRRALRRLGFSPVQYCATEVDPGGPRRPGPPCPSSPRVPGRCASEGGPVHRTSPQGRRRKGHPERPVVLQSGGGSGPTSSGPPMFPFSPGDVEGLLTRDLTGVAGGGERPSSGGNPGVLPGVGTTRVPRACRPLPVSGGVGESRCVDRERHFRNRRWSASTKAGKSKRYYEDGTYRHRHVS